MTSPYRSPGASASRTAHWVAGPGQGLDTRQATKPKKAGTGGAMATATVLRIWRPIILVICVVIGFFSAYHLTQRELSTEYGRDAAEEIVTVAQLRAEVNSAEAAMLNARATGSAADLQTGQDELSQLATELLKLDSNWHQEQLGKVNSALIVYAGELRLASAQPYGDLSAVAAARQGLDMSIDDLIAAEEATINTVRSPAWWVLALQWLPAVLLLVLSIQVARRTKRVFTLGLVIALLAASAAGYLAYQTETSSATVLTGTPGVYHQQAYDFAHAQQAVRQLELNDIRLQVGVIDATTWDTSRAENEYTIMNAVERSVDETFTNANDAIGLIHNKFVLDPTAELTETESAELASAYDILDEWLASKVQESLDSFDSTSASVFTETIGMSGLVSLIQFAAGVSATVGINRHIRRYR